MFAAIEVTRTAARRAVFDAASSGGVGELTLGARLPIIDFFVKQTARPWVGARYLLPGFGNLIFIFLSVVQKNAALDALRGGDIFVCGITLPITGLRQTAKRAVAIPVDWRVGPQCH